MAKMREVTIATHNGSKVRTAHNIRAKSCVEKEPHIDPNGHYEIWQHEEPRKAYDRIFGQALKEYNEKQTREDRIIKSYYNKVAKSSTQHPAYEMIIGIYGNVTDGEAREIMKTFVNTWKERNPNLELIGAYYHADEEGKPHCHLDYIPIAHNYTKGLSIQAGLVKALGEQGFEKENNITAQIKWEKRENEYLENLCKERKLEVLHPQKDKIKHLHTAEYKEIKTIESNIAKKEKIYAKAEKRAEKAIERKRRAFSRSYKKLKDGRIGFAYDKELANEIKYLVEDRKSDVKKLINSDVSLQAEKDNINQILEQAEQLRLFHKEELEKVRKTQLNQRKIIEERAKELANERVDGFLETRYNNPKDRGAEARLRKFCSEIEFSNGKTALQLFDEMENARKIKDREEWIKGR